MINLTCVKIVVKPEFIEPFIQATLENHRESLKEAGNLRFDFLQSKEKPEEFMLYEVYLSDEAASAHKSTAHYMKWRDTVADWMAVSRQGSRYNVVAPVQSGQWRS